MPCDPFAWGPRKIKGEPSLFEVAYVSSRWHPLPNTAFRLSGQPSFLEEWLYAWPSGKKQTWFEGEENRVFKFGRESEKARTRSLRESLGPNAFVSFSRRAVEASTVGSDTSAGFASLEVNQKKDLPRPSPIAFFHFASSRNSMLARLCHTEFTGSPSCLRRERSYRSHLLHEFSRFLAGRADTGDSGYSREKQDGIGRETPQFTILAPLSLRHQGGTDDAWLPRRKSQLDAEMRPIWHCCHVYP